MAKRPSKKPAPARPLAKSTAALRQALSKRTKAELVTVLLELAEADRGVKRNLSRLIDSRHLRTAMQLALDLIKAASYQVEMSDEGLMTDDIEDCLSVVLKALTTCDLPADAVVAWCSAMLDNDRVGFIAREPLVALRNRIQTAAAR